jgi:hypothetical protein
VDRPGRGKSSVEVRLQSTGAAADVAGDRVDTATHDEDEVMDYLRRLQYERPWLYWVVFALALWLGFRLVLLVAALLLGPFGLPGWVPLVVVVGGLVLIARRQQRTH